MSTNGKDFINLPVHQHSAAAFKPFPDEGIADREMFENILILNVIYFDNKMSVVLEQIGINRQA